jgi:hypothetical protein
MGKPVRRPFLRESSGLVNLESYLPYLEHPPEDIPITLPFNNQGPLVHQHVYFREADYRQDGVPVEDKDMDLVWMRRISYNQVIMGRLSELILHRDHEEHVAPPSPETNQKCLEDYAHIDAIGAAIIGKVVALKPEVRPVILPGSGQPARMDVLSPLERAEFFDNQLAISLEALRQPKVTPERVVTSALKRMSIYLNNPELQSEADRRLREDSIYYPLRMPKMGKLYHVGNELVARAFESEKLAA